MNDEILTLLEEIRSIAQTGLDYAKDPYNLERYARLLDLAGKHYVAKSDMPQLETITLLKQQIGQITPKVTVSAAIFAEDGKMLLVNRSDGSGWGPPGGFCEVYEGPEENGSSRGERRNGCPGQGRNTDRHLPSVGGRFRFPFTIYTLLYHCSLVSGVPSTSLEAKEVGFYDIDTIPSEARFLTNLHRCQVARAFWRAM